MSKTWVPSLCSFLFRQAIVDIKCKVTGTYVSILTSFSMDFNIRINSNHLLQILYFPSLTAFISILFGLWSLQCQVVYIIICALKPLCLAAVVFTIFLNLITDFCTYKCSYNFFVDHLKFYFVRRFAGATWFQNNGY